MPEIKSQKVINEVKRLLPQVRGEVLKEFKEWKEYIATKAFYSDDAVLEVLPLAAYDFLLLNWCIKPERINARNVIYVLDNRLFSSLPIIVAHALRKLASEEILAGIVLTHHKTKMNS